MTVAQISEKNRLRDELVSAVRGAFDDPDCQVSTWRTTPLMPGAGSATGGILRVNADLEVCGQQQPWSVVLKVLRPNSSASERASWNYWKREACLYRSDIPEQLPEGVTAPRCFGVEDRADGSISIWLEDLGSTMSQPWTLSDYVVAARNLGRMNGEWLVNKRPPDLPWLSQRTLASWIGNPLPDLERWPEAMSDPLIGPHCDEEIGRRAIELFHRHMDILDTLARLPQTLSHGDAHRGNMALRHTPSGAREAVLFDWAFTGIRAVGEELESFVSAASLFFHIEHLEIDALSDAAFEGYVAGLNDAGWTGDVNDVRMGYLGAATLRYALVPIEVYMLDLGLRKWFCDITGRPLGETLERYIAVRRWGMEQEDELRRLMEMAA